MGIWVWFFCRGQNFLFPLRTNEAAWNIIICLLLVCSVSTLVALFVAGGTCDSFDEMQLDSSSCGIAVWFFLSCRWLRSLISSWDIECFLHSGSEKFHSPTNEEDYRNHSRRMCEGVLVLFFYDLCSSVLDCTGSGCSGSCWHSTEVLNEQAALDMLPLLSGPS